MIPQYFFCRAEQLNEDAAQFQKCAEKITKKMWWQDTKAKIGLGAAILLVILLVIIVPLSLPGVAAIGSRSGHMLFPNNGILGQGG